MPKHLVVAGGGAKAAAIGAKTAVLDALGLLGDLGRVTIIEKHCVGANWDGSQGLTNGQQRLVTEPERDVGFPYTEERFGPRVPARLASHYSWQAYLVSGGAAIGYHEWIDKGRPHPTNWEWAEYLRWVLGKAVAESSRVDVREGVELRGIEAEHGRIRLHLTSLGGADTLVCDGLVVTGPGPAIRLRPPSPNVPRVFDGCSFWQASSDSLEKDDELPYVVIGAGGAAANVVVELIERRRGMLSPGILILSVAGAIYTRGGGYFERRHSSDPSHWRELATRARLELISRGDRGVVAPATLQRIYEARGVEFKTLSDIRVVENEDASDEEAVLAVLGRQDDGETIRIPTDFVVEAIGFDPWWFVPILAPDARARCEEYRLVFDRYREFAGCQAYMKLIGDRKDGESPILRSEYDIQPDLSLPQILTGSRLHVPMLADLAQGPGYPNLSCLGLVADRILESYVFR